MDLGPDTVIALTLQVHDLGDLESRNTNFTNKFKLPPTQNNRFNLGFVDDPRSATNKAYRKQTAKYVEDGVEIIPEGIAIVEDATEFISVVLYDGNINFFDLVDGLSVQDLDLSLWDHTWDFNTVRATHGNTTGLKYPLVDYGHLTNSSATFDTKFFRPAFYEAYLFEKTFTEQGYTVSGSLLSRTDFLSLIVPFVSAPQEEVFRNSSQRWVIVYGDYTPALAVTPLAWVDTFNSLGGGFVDEYLYLRFKITNATGGPGNNYIQIYIIDGGASTILDTVAGDGIHSSYVSRLTRSPDNQVSVYFVVRNCDVEILGGRFFGWNTNDQTQFFNVALPHTTLTAGNTPQDYFAGFQADGEDGYFETIDMARFGPNITQTDFVKAVLNKFGAFIKTDHIKREAQIFTLREVKDNELISRDWTSKLHMDKSQWKLQYRIGQYYQNTEFKYREDTGDEDIEPGLGNGSLSIDDTTLPATGTKIELPFSATQMVVRLTGLDVPLIKMVDSGVYANTVEPRVLIDDTRDTSISVTFDEDTNSVTTASSIPMCYFQLPGETFNLGFDNSLLDDNYTELEDVLLRAKKLTLPFDLKITDVYRFDHSIPVYLDQFAAHFYVNKINNFKNGSLTQVELIRL